MSGLGEAVAITWTEYDLKIKNTNETTESLATYVSVPEHSCKRNAKGSEMVAMDLAKRSKTVMTEMGVKRLTVKARVCIGEYWTKEMADSANIEIRKNIYGSQYQGGCNR